MFGEIHASSVVACAQLGVLTLHNGVDGGALYMIAEQLKNLNALRLIDCSALKDKDLVRLFPLLSGGCGFVRLWSLRLEGLNRYRITDGGLNCLFAEAPEWTRRLTALGIEYSVFPDEGED